MKLRTVDDFGSLRGKRVLLRVDFNVPVTKRRIMDDAKIRFALPTIERLHKAGAMIILVSHLGEGGPDESLRPVAQRLQKLLVGIHPRFLTERIGSSELVSKIAKMRPGDVVLLENIRSYSGETKNSVTFAKQLAALADVYVNDAFAVSHRAHASVARVAGLLPSAVGLLVEREVSVLSRLLKNPFPPFIALMGGAKITTKVPVIENLLAVADAVLIGGALANTFFRARGFGVGASLVDVAGFQIARRLLRKSTRRNLLLPIDVVVGDASHKRRTARVVSLDCKKPFVICGEREAILDIGPATILAYSQQLKSAATIVWNGPMGMFEHPPFHHGSIALARVIATRSSGRAFGVVGGGETLAILNATHMAKYIDHVSSGGGAMLAFLAGEKLPGLIPLLESGRQN